MWSLTGRGMNSCTTGSRQIIAWHFGWMWSCFRLWLRFWGKCGKRSRKQEIFTASLEDELISLAFCHWNIFFTPNVSPCGFVRDQGKRVFFLSLWRSRKAKRYAQKNLFQWRKTQFYWNVLSFSCPAIFYGLQASRSFISFSQKSVSLPSCSY